MVKINGTTISITRSDAAYIKFKFVDADGNEISLDANTTVSCQVRGITNDDYDTKLLFNGEVTRNTTTDENNETHVYYIWHIKPSDTATVDTATDYLWDAQIEFANNDTYTFIEASKFKIKPEVTLRSASDDGAVAVSETQLSELLSYVFVIEIPGEVEV